MPIFNQEKKENLKDKTALIYDLGLFTEMAAALKRTGFGRVLYYVPWQAAFPDSSNQKIGIDFKGIERVQEFWDYVDEADVICFFDTYTGDLADYLRDQGHRVFGVGHGQELELDRWGMRTRQFDAGLPTQPSLRLKSIEDVELYFKGINNETREQTGSLDKSVSKARLAYILKKYRNFSEDYFVGGKKDVLLREWLGGAKKKFVKSNMRGDIETFYAPGFDQSLSKFNSLSEKFGHRFDSSEIEFVIEDKVEGVEPGFDGIHVDGEFLSPTSWGFEIKSGIYIGRVLGYGDLPEPVRMLNGEIAEFLKEYNPWASFFSAEFIMGRDLKPYLIDPCVRNPAPVGSAIYSELYLNLAEVVWAAAGGEKVAPVSPPGVRYVSGVSVDSSWAEDHELEVEVEKEAADWMKFRRAYVKDGKFYAVSGFSSVGSVIGFGRTIEEAVKKTVEHSGKVKAYNIDMNLGTLKEAQEEIKKLEEFMGQKF